MNHRAKQAMTTEQQAVINRALTAAIKAWDLDLIKGAVESGADTQELLTQSIAKKSPEFARLALQYGADAGALAVNAGGKYQPVLHYAHENFNEEVFNLILARNVPIDLRNPQGETVAQRAARGGDFDRMRFYLGKGADLSANAQEVLVKAIDKKDLAAMEWSVQHGADVHGKVRVSDDVMNTLLHQAFGNFREDMMDFLLRQGVGVDARNSSGETVLHLAARQADQKKVEYLLKNGADPLATTYGGVSVLDEALKAMSASERDSDRYSSYSSSSSKTKEAKAAVTLLLTRVKDTYGVEPYSTSVQRDFTVSKPITVSGKTRDESGPKAP